MGGLIDTPGLSFGTGLQWSPKIGNAGLDIIAGVAPFIDAIGATAFAGYSLRKLRAAYSGNAVNVRRSSDNTTTDIGFDGSGNFNVAAFSSFVGAGSGFVATCYDQSGNGANATQATQANQPQIILNAIGGKPTVRFNGTSTYLQAGPSLSPTSMANLTEFAVLALRGANANARAAATMDNTNDTDWTSGSVLNASNSSTASLGWGGAEHHLPVRHECNAGRIPSVCRLDETGERNRGICARQRVGKFGNRDRCRDADGDHPTRRWRNERLRKQLVAIGPLRGRDLRFGSDGVARFGPRQSESLLGHPLG